MQLVILFAFYVFLKVVRIIRKLLDKIGFESQQTIFWVNLDNDISRLSDALDGLRVNTGRDTFPEILTKRTVRFRRFLVAIRLRRRATPEETVLEERVLLGHHDHPSQDHWPEYRLGSHDQMNEHIYHEHANGIEDIAYHVPMVPLELHGDRPCTSLERQSHEAAGGHLLAQPSSAHLLANIPGLSRRTNTLPRQGSD